MVWWFGSKMSPKSHRTKAWWPAWWTFKRQSFVVEAWSLGHTIEEHVECWTFPLSRLPGCHEVRDTSPTQWCLHPAPNQQVMPTTTQHPRNHEPKQTSSLSWSSWMFYHNDGQLTKGGGKTIKPEKDSRKTVCAKNWRILSNPLLYLL